MDGTLTTGPIEGDDFGPSRRDRAGAALGHTGVAG